MKLDEKALLVEAHWSTWRANKLDRKATKSAAEAYGIANASEAGRFTKKLMSGGSYKAIMQLTTQWRSFHKNMTLPWNNDGMRLLPITAHDAYVKGTNIFDSEFESLRQALVVEFEQLKEEAKSRLNGLYNESDYPVGIGDYFGSSVQFWPVPASQDIRVNLAEDEVEKIVERTQAQVEAKERAAIRDIWERVHSVIQKVSETLSQQRVDKDGEQLSPIFRDTLLTNVQDMAAILPLLNMNNDPDLTELATRVAEDIASFDPDTLRHNEGARIAVARSARKLLADIDSKLGV